MNIKRKKRVTVKTHDEMIASWMAEPAFKAAYDDLEAEYQLLREMLRARKEAGLTQAEVARRMGTQAPAIARLEASNMRTKHSPSLSTLSKYAHAVGCTLEIYLRPLAQRYA